jgi:large subunit ribosomal protein L5e
MPFVKVQKNNVYSKRFQVKFRRRRIGKTDYYQRKRLILQRKNKYNTAKWRFVVRRTNQRIICQVVWSTLKGDKVKSSADSFELRKWGVTAGLTNYAAAYATGLLCARRLLAILDKENEGKLEKKMSQTFDLKTEPGEDVNLKELCEKKGIEQRPFTCYLDLGLARATKGNRVFAAMKGAIDGGINIPHSDSIFPSPKEEEEEAPKKGKGGKSASAPKKEKKKDDENMLRDRIFGVHVQKYMDLYEKKDKDKKQEHQFIKLKECLKNSGSKTLEDLYKKVHDEIRKNPLKEKKEKIKGYKRDGTDPNTIVPPDGKNFKRFKRFKRLTNAQRKENVKKKIAEFLANRGKSA